MKRDISASLWAIWAEFILAERGDCGLSSCHGCSLRVLLPATMPIESFCRYRRRCQKKKLYIAQKKTREKRPFCFFWSLRPRKPSNTSKYTSNCSGEREAGRLAAVFHTPGNSWPPGRRSQRLDGAGKRCGQKLQGQVAQSALLAEVRCSTAARRFKR